MREPCGTRKCIQYINQNGGDPENPAEWICSNCGAEGPMSEYYDQLSEEES